MEEDKELSYILDKTFKSDRFHKIKKENEIFGARQKEEELIFKKWIVKIMIHQIKILMNIFKKDGVKDRLSKHEVNNGFGYDHFFSGNYLCPEIEKYCNKFYPDGFHNSLKFPLTDRLVESYFIGGDYGDLHKVENGEYICNHGKE